MAQSEGVEASTCQHAILVRGDKKCLADVADTFKSPTEQSVGFFAVSTETFDADGVDGRFLRLLPTVAE
jgi:hypothetical protein